MSPCLDGEVWPQLARPSGLSVAAVACRLDRPQDPLVAGAAAEVAGQALSYLLLGRIRVVAEERGDRHDEPGRAEAALEPVIVAERGLHRRQLAVGAADALDGRDVGAVGL